jgi:hypothetical protein
MQTGDENFSRVRFEDSARNTVGVTQMGFGNTSNVYITNGNANAVTVLQSGM